MSDADVRDLARRAGIAVDWSDYAGKRHAVPLDAVRRILTALGLPCDTAGHVAHSTRFAGAPKSRRGLITATVGQPITLGLKHAHAPRRAQLVQEHGGVLDLEVSRTAEGVQLPGIASAGYHSLRDWNGAAHARGCAGAVLDRGGYCPRQAAWGLAAQTYGLRSAGDCGIGDMAGAVALAKAAAWFNADALALSPTHALFAADPAHFSPYSPSNRLFYNPLLADPTPLFGRSASRG